jgi:tetratricopeptide (TPR) repeat protein
MLLRKYINYYVFFIICCIIIISFSPLFNADFLEWDDRDYITKNPSIQFLSLQNIKLFFSKSYLGNYHPLTMLSFSLDYLIGNGNPFFFHTTNIFLHIFNTYIIYLIIRLISKNEIIAIITCLLFATHPLSVESVAWISERKNLLYTFFFLISILFFVKYTVNNKKKYYWFCLLFFLLSLLSKGQAVTLPFTLIAIIWIIKKQFFDKKLFFNLIPFFILSIIFGIIAIVSQYNDGYINMSINTSIFDKISIACYSYCIYVVKIIFPINLSALHPFPKHVDYIFSLYIIPTLCILFLFIYSIKKQLYLLGAIILIFTSNIVFILQILPLGGYMYADRYTYIPSIAIFLIPTIVLYTSFSLMSKKIITIFFLIIIIGNSFITYGRSKIFTNSNLLYEDILKKYPSDEITLNSMSALMINNGNYDKALVYVNKAINSDSKYFQAYFNKGMIYYKLGDDTKALVNLKKCISLEPKYYDAYYIMAQIFIKQQLYDKAIGNLNTVINLKKDYKQAYYYRGLCFAFLKQFENSVFDYKTAQNLGYNNDLLFINRAIVYGQLGDFNNAISDLNNAIVLNPQSAQSYYLRGIAKFQLGKNGCDDLLIAKQNNFPNSDNAFYTYCK